MPKHIFRPSSSLSKIALKRRTKVNCTNMTRTNLILEDLPRTEIVTHNENYSTVSQYELIQKSNNSVSKDLLELTLINLKN